ncbi:1-acyl-sn-glycerol-3-phosphate acyltransferase [Patescibacteria group bacterium]|nr:1-acyl-sn-glycerol-3-phosphate acyltransferase [Patescibacteria group bacterium]
MTDQIDTSHDAMTGTIAASGVLPRASSGSFVNHFAMVTQFLTWPILFPLFHILFSLSIRGRENFRAVRGSFIVVSNHVAFYDSFLFRMILGAWTPHLPLRFMAVSKFRWRWLNFLSRMGVIKFIYSLFGVFTVVPGRGIGKNLEEARKIIADGGNVAIFAEGGIYTGPENARCRPGMCGVGPFKKGAAVLQKETGVSVVPVSFRVFPSFFRRRIVVNVGGPMNLLPGRSVEEITRSFHSAVEGLYART